MAAAGRKRSSMSRALPNKLIPPFAATCPHLDPLLSNPVRASGLRQLVSTLCAFSIAKQRLVCASCPTGTPTDGRLHACLDCSELTCWLSQHSQLHAHNTHHSFSLEVTRATLFCFHCTDYVYSPLLDVYLAPLLSLRNGSLHKRDFDSIGGEERSLLAQMNSTSHPNSIGVLGLRGMYNMGSTCYLASVLQCLVHNPLLQLYYLSELHTPSRCPISLAAAAPHTGNYLLYSDGLGGVTPEPPVPPPPSYSEWSGRGGVASSSQQVAPTPLHVSKFRAGPCMSCDLDRVYGQVFSGEIVPFAPHDFLHNLWRSSLHLAGYHQQDAHELFMSICDSCHSAEKSNMQLLFGLDIKDETQCPCVMHRIFGGMLRSEIVCNTCSNSSVKLDPFFNASVDVPVAPVAPPSPSPSDPEKPMGSKDPEDSNPAADAPSGAISVHDCLRQFSKLEQLGQAEAVQCTKCKVPRQSTKQLSFQTLPLTFCLHIKRFVQLPPNARRNPHELWSKIETHVEFPLYGFDPSAYLHANQPGAAAAAAAVARRGGPRSKQPAISPPHASASHPPGFPPIKDTWVYDLSSVVVHVGTLNAGHYVSYIRRNTSWYLVDDDKIYLVREEDVRRANAYMLFYVRRSVAPEEAQCKPSIVQLQRQQQSRPPPPPPVQQQPKSSIQQQQQQQQSLPKQPPKKASVEPK